MTKIYETFPLPPFACIEAKTETISYILCTFQKYSLSYQAEKYFADTISDSDKIADPYNVKIIKRYCRKTKP